MGRRYISSAKLENETKWRDLVFLGLISGSTITFFLVVNHDCRFFLSCHVKLFYNEAKGSIILLLLGEMVDPPPYECDAACRCAEAASEVVALQGVFLVGRWSHHPASADIHWGAVPATQGRGRIPLLHLLQPGVLRLRGGL